MKMTEDMLSILHGKMLKIVEKERKYWVSLLVLREWEAHGKNDEQQSDSYLNILYNNIWFPEKN